MRSVGVVLAWTLGLPAALGLYFALFCGWTAAWRGAAQGLDYSADAGIVAAVSLIFLAMGAVFGIQECREGR